MRRMWAAQPDDRACRICGGRADARRRRDLCGALLRGGPAAAGDRDTGWHLAREGGRWSAWSCSMAPAWYRSDLLIGLPLALASTRILTSLLVGVSPSDPLTYAVVVIVLGVTSLLAAFARHAAQPRSVRRRCLPKEDESAGQKWTRTVTRLAPGTAMVHGAPSSCPGDHSRAPRQGAAARGARPGLARTVRTSLAAPPIVRRHPWRAGPCRLAAAAQRAGRTAPAQSFA